MKSLHRYIIKNFLTLFFSITIVITAIIMSLQYFDWSGKFAECNMDFGESIYFICMYSVVTLKELFPLSFLLTTIICFGLMNSNNEIISLRSAGISNIALIKPMLFIFFFTTLFLFLSIEFFVPYAKKRTNYIKNAKMAGRKIETEKKDNLWLKKDNRIIYVKYYNPVKKSFTSAKINILDDTFKLRKKMFAERGVYSEKSWILYNLIEQEFDKEGSLKSSTFYKKKKVNIELSPKNLKNSIVNLEEMGFSDILKHIKKIKNTGHNITTFQTNLYSKISFLFLPIILSIIGFSLSTRIEFRSKMTLVIIYGLIIAFLYWISNGFFIALSNGGLLNPISATLIPILTLFFISIYLFKRIN